MKYRCIRLNRYDHYLQDFRHSDRVDKKYQVLPEDHRAWSLELAPKTSLEASSRVAILGPSTASQLRDCFVPSVTARRW